ncbi:MAG TPA: prolyl-tRNA synthetase associated domain-containing protein [Acidobacteriota bacterium]|nr:prolyl-tRNA synthetase associated domain-containing protein [Acidobacteriota bacterium]
MNDSEREVLACLEAMGIPYVRHEHPPVATVAEAEKYWTGLRGAHCKNLFLRNNKGNRHYLVVAEASRRVDLKALTRTLGEDRLSFASPERLKRYLGLEAGSVSPFGLVHDSEKEVRVVVDVGLRDAGKVNFHPNVNTATLEISFGDFERFLARCGNRVEYVGFD